MPTKLKKIIAIAGILVVPALFGYAWFLADQCSRTQSCGGYRSPAQEARQINSEENLWSRTLSDPTAFFTAVLCVFTGVLAVASLWQGRLIIRADQTARIAADAANETASALATQNTHIRESIAEAKRSALAMEVTAEATRIMAERQLVSQCPFLAYSIYSLYITTTDPPERTKLKDYRISLQFKNVGRDIATDVGYSVGPIFSPASIENEITRDDLGKKFADTIFGLDNKPGRIYVTQDTTVDLDQIIVGPEYLNALYRKEIRFFVWCVMRYGSRLRAPEWFVEIAVYLEFVLEADPETYMLTDKTASPRPFRVAIPGYRYREGHDQPKSGQSK
jgi:hypothetical protein